MTWNYFGPLIAAPEADRVRFSNWLVSNVEPGAEPNRHCQIDLWRRIPHPDNLVPGGPELDFVIDGDKWIVFGEAKWRSSVGKGQGVGGDKTQLQLREEFLDKYGRWIYGDRRFMVLLVTLHDEPESPSWKLPVRHLTWDDLCACPHHPLGAEVNRYYQWKRERSR